MRCVVQRRSVVRHLAAILNADQGCGSWVAVAFRLAVLWWCSVGAESPVWARSVGSRSLSGWLPHDDKIVPGGIWPIPDADSRTQHLTWTTVESSHAGFGRRSIQSTKERRSLRDVYASAAWHRVLGRQRREGCM